MDSNFIHNPEAGNGRRKIALALAAVAVTSLVLASQASAKPGKAKKEKSGGEVQTESIVGVTTMPASTATAPPAVSWGEVEGVRWR